MKTSPAAARILVASDSVDDGRQIVRLLESVFATVSLSTVAERAVDEFQSFRPAVLVLAFDTLEKSERYYLGLYRLGAGGVSVPHRTVVLCSREDVAAAYELCKRDYFDDYVLYWPQSYDGNRLAMSVWIACRHAADAKQDSPSNGDLLQHARHLAELERVVAGPAATAVDLRQRMQPSLEGTRPVASALRALKPVVLVVEDDEFARQMVRQAVDPERWQLLFAVDGASAEAQLGRVKVDVILMDVRLPDVDGIDLTRRLKASPKTAAIPILMLTGDARRETLIGSLEAGAAGFVVKPVTRATLEAKLDKILPR